jgi:predicted GNAT family acetyltransferase
MPARTELVVHLSAAGQARAACSCMTDVPTPWPEALAACREWIAQDLGTRIQGLHLQDAEGAVIGHLYYASSQHALVPYTIEDDVAVVLCAWIQPRHRGKGYAQLLRGTLTRQLADEEYKGILLACIHEVQCLSAAELFGPEQDRLRPVGPAGVLYYPLREERIEVRALELRIVPRHADPVEITVFTGGFCPYDVSTSLVAVQVAREFGKRVVVQEIPASTESLRRYGTASGIFINGRRTLQGAAPEEAIRRAIYEALEGE